MKKGRNPTESCAGEGPQATNESESYKSSIFCGRGVGTGGFVERLGKLEKHERAPSGRVWENEKITNNTLYVYAN